MDPHEEELPQRGGLRDSAEPGDASSLARRLEAFSFVDRGGVAGASKPWVFYRAHRSSVAIALAVLGWFPIAAFVVFGSEDHHELRDFARDLAVHVRALIAVPILVLSESVIDRRLRSAARQLVESHHIPFSERPSYARLLGRITHLRDSPIAAACIVTLAAVGSVLSAKHSLARPDAAWSIARGTDGTLHATPAAWWLVAVSVPVFEMLALLWIWRWILWTSFAWRVSRLRLRLVATHPDRSAGLAFLSASASSFALVALALGTVLSAAWTARIVKDRVPLEHFVTLMTAYAILVMVFVFVPLLGFTTMLRRVHHEAIERYGLLVQRYIVRFDHMWTGESAPRDENSLRDLDAQNMADLGDVFERVEQMRFLPLAPIVLQDLVVGIVVPLLPLLLAAMSPKEMLQRIVGALL